MSLSSALVSAWASSLAQAPAWALAAAAVVAALAVLVVWQNAEMRSYKGVRLPPSHVSWLPYGIDKILSRMTASDHAFLDYTVQLYRTRGPMGMVRIGGRTVIIANEPDCIKHVLATNFDNYEKGALSRRIFQEFLGQGIFAADGHGWQTQRDTARVHFLREDLDSMVPAFARHGHVLTGILARHAASGEPADLQDLFLRFTMDSVAEILFGTPFSTLEHPTTFATAFDAVQVHIDRRFQNPFYEITEKLFGNARFEGHIKTLTREAEAMIKSAFEDKNLAKRTDLLAHFINSMSEAGNTPDVGYLRDMLMNFLIAGRDTTGVLLSWTCLMIADHPEVEAKLLEEIDQVVGRDRDPTPEDIKNLRYMKQVINEVLRLYPSVPADFRMAINDDILPNGYAVPAGSMVVYSAYVLHRSELLFGPTADKFDPDRWSPERAKDVRPFFFVPFHAGPRICLGQNMAYTEARVMLTLLLQRFSVRRAPNHKVLMKRAIILSSSTGNKMILTARAPPA